MKVVLAEKPSVARDIARVLGAAERKEDHYTGGGFPRVFYLRYHGYAKFFPLWALARYRNLTRSNERRVAFGM